MKPSQNPCPDPPSYQVHFAVITVSDTRTPETDKSGNFIKQSMTNAGHFLDYYTLVKDEPDEIREQMYKLAAIAALDAIILNGGTGIAPRDTTYDAIAALLEKTLPTSGGAARDLVTPTAAWHYKNS